MKKFFFSCLIGLIILIQNFNLVLGQSSGVYWGGFTTDTPAFESSAQKRVSLIMFFHNWGTGDFPYGKMSDIRNRGSIPIVSWDSYIPEKSNEINWKSISEGKMDGYITQWARDSRNWGKPYFLRLDWEMNGYWHPFSYQSEYFAPMWRHIHDIFVREGANNVTWVWCPNVDSFATKPLEPLYPGDSYVDWLCMDGYNFGTTQSWSGWESFASLFGPTYNHFLRISANKPIMVGEMGTAEDGGSKALWISEMLGKDLPKNFPNIKAFLWFNLNKEADWRIESSESSKNAFAMGISSSFYAANDFGNITSSPIPYMGSLSSKPFSLSTKTVLPTVTFAPTATASPTAEPTVLPSTPTVEVKVSSKVTENNSLGFNYLLLSPALIFVFGTTLLIKRSFKKKAV